MTICYDEKRTWQAEEGNNNVVLCSFSPLKSCCKKWNRDVASYIPSIFVFTSTISLTFALIPSIIFRLYTPFQLCDAAFPLPAILLFHYLSYLYFHPLLSVYLSVLPFTPTLFCFVSIFLLPLSIISLSVSKLHLSLQPAALFRCAIFHFSKLLMSIGGHRKVNGQSKSPIYPDLLSNTWVKRIQDDGEGSRGLGRPDERQLMQGVMEWEDIWSLSLSTTCLSFSLCAFQTEH